MSSESDAKVTLRFESSEEHSHGRKNEGNL